MSLDEYAANATAYTETLSAQMRRFQAESRIALGDYDAHRHTQPLPARPTRDSRGRFTAMPQEQPNYINILAALILRTGVQTPSSARDAVWSARRDKIREHSDFIARRMQQAPPRRSTADGIWTWLDVWSAVCTERNTLDYNQSLTIDAVRAWADQYATRVTSAARLTARPPAGWDEPVPWDVVEADTPVEVTPDLTEEQVRIRGDLDNLLSNTIQVSGERRSAHNERVNRLHRSLDELARMVQEGGGAQTWGGVGVCMERYRNRNRLSSEVVEDISHLARTRGATVRVMRFTPVEQDVSEPVQASTMHEQHRALVEHNINQLLGLKPESMSDADWMGHRHNVVLHRHALVSAVMNNEWGANDNRPPARWLGVYYCLQGQAWVALGRHTEMRDSILRLATADDRDRRDGIQVALPPLATPVDPGTLTPRMLDRDISPGNVFQWMYNNHSVVADETGVAAREVRDILGGLAPSHFGSWIVSVFGGQGRYPMSFIPYSEALRAYSTSGHEMSRNEIDRIHRLAERERNAATIRQGEAMPRTRPDPWTATVPNTFSDTVSGTGWLTAPPAGGGGGVDRFHIDLREIPASLTPRVEAVLTSLEAGEDVDRDRVMQVLSQVREILNYEGAS